MRIQAIDKYPLKDQIQIGEATKLSPWTAENYISEMKNPDAVLLRLASEANETVGFVVGRIILGAIEAVPEAEIYNIAVIESAQRSGHGQTLLDRFTAICADRNVKRIWLEVRESNRSAIAFYERNDFMVVQTRNHFYSDPREHALLMKREL